MSRFPLRITVVLGASLVASLGVSAASRAQSAGPFVSPFVDFGQPPTTHETIDLDGDGWIDIVAAHQGGALIWARGRGDATFEPEQELAPSIGIYPDLLSGDVDGDGRDDVLMVHGSLNRLRVFLSLGGGAVALTQDLPVSLTAGGQVLADFDGDLDLDVVAAGDAPAQVLLLTNDGSGHFTLASTIPCAECALDDVAVGDVSGDHRPDVLVSCKSKGFVLVFRQTAAGRFQRWASIPMNTPDLLALGDFDADSRLDVAAMQAETAGVGVSFNLGGGEFAPSIDVVQYLHLRALQAVDIDENGVDDLLTHSNVVYTLINPGDGAFTLQAVGGSPWYRKSSPMIDVNGDGDLDLVMNNASQASGPLTVLRGQGDGTLGPVYTEVEGQCAYGDVDGDGYGDFVGPSATDGDMVALMPGLSGGRFAGAKTTDSYVGMTKAELADFDEDGVLDCVTVAYNKVMLHFGSPSMAFLDASLLWDGSGGNLFPWPLTGDVNSDGHADAILVTGIAIKVFLGHGDGSFDDLAVQDSPFGAHAPSLADFDGDGQLDLGVAVNLTSAGGVAVTLGHGDGSFGPPTVYLSGKKSILATGDLDGDFDLDLLAAHTNNSQLTVLLNDGHGVFAAGAPVVLAQPNVWCLVVADFDADGRADIAAGERDPDLDKAAGRVHVYSGTGSANFAWTQSVLVSRHPGDLIAADADHDGVSDLLVSPGPVVLLSQAGPWRTLGFPLAGSHGLPRLIPEGSLAPLSPMTLSLTDAARTSSAWLVTGTSAAHLPFRSGVMVPLPQSVSGPHTTDAEGDLTLQFSAPLHAPPGLERIYQFWISDPGGPMGFAASNAIAGVNP